jgi:hypothetical protein
VACRVAWVRWRSLGKGLRKQVGPVFSKDPAEGRRIQDIRVHRGDT